MILACPACDRRYDVTGRARGQLFQCECGATMRFAAMPAPVDPTEGDRPRFGGPTGGAVPTSHLLATLVDELACPACGGSVSSTASACAQCHAALLVKACPRCLSRVFHGFQHCPACGAEIGLAAGDTGTLDAERRCPRCAGALHARRIADIVIDECGGCRGVFLDVTATKRVLFDHGKTERAEALLQALPRAEVHPLPSAGQKMYLPCPICHVVMNRRLFATGTGLIIDVCRTHGTFFDAGELPQIIELVLNGGIDKPARRPADHAREPRPDISQVLPTALPVARVVHDPSRARTAAVVLVEILAAIFD